MNSWIVDESKWLIINLVGLIQNFDADFSFSAIPIERGFPQVIGFALGLSCGTTAVCAHWTMVAKVDFFFCVPKQLPWIFRFFKTPGFLFNIYFKNWQNYTYRQEVLFLMWHFLSFGDGDVGREGAWGGSDRSPNCISCVKSVVFMTIWLFCGYLCTNSNSWKLCFWQLSLFFKML